MGEKKSCKESFTQPAIIHASTYPKISKTMKVQKKKKLILGCTHFPPQPVGFRIAEV